MDGSTGQPQRRSLGRTRGTLAVALFAVTSIVAAACVGPSARPATQAPAQPPSAARSAPAAPATPSIASAADWPVYHFDAQRSGNYPSFPTFTGSLAPGWSAVLDGAVYGQPLVVNGVVIAATEGDSVYAIDSGTGAIMWHRNLGTPVPLSSLPCGDINPLGITGTPAYDSTTNSIFVVA